MSKTKPTPAALRKRHLKTLRGIARDYASVLQDAEFSAENHRKWNSRWVDEYTKEASRAQEDVDALAAAIELMEGAK